MKNYDLAERYARAAYALTAKSEKKQRQWLVDMQILAELQHTKPEIMRYFSLPKQLAPKQKEILTTSLNNGVDPLLINFLLYLIEKRRFGDLEAISLAYSKLVAKQIDEYEGSLTMALPIEPELKQRLEKHFSKLLGKPLHLSDHVDPKLIAGGVMKVNDWLVDFSAKGRLARLKSHLLAKQI